MAGAHYAHAETAAWPSAGNGMANTRASTGETLVTASTVSRLTPLWTFKASGEVPDTPTIDGDAAYVVDAGGSVYRLAAAPAPSFGM